jgi:translation initiation factor 3 subunit C
MIYAAHQALQDIWASNHVKELLAQGIVGLRYQEKTPEQEKIEKRRQIPFHMHINIEMLECVYYVCSMLLEIPNLAQGPGQRVISKSFRRQLDYFCRQTFNGPPENTRDHVMAGALAMKEGNWEKCVDLILGLKVWKLFPDPEGTRVMLKAKIQEEALRTYLFTFSGYYDSLALGTLRSVGVLLF